MSSALLRDIYLHGRLGDEFGPHFRLAVRDAAEAIRALCFQLKDFRKVLLAGNWQVIRGDYPNAGRPLSKEYLRLGLGDDPLHIVPAVAGSGRGGGKIAAGIVLIAASIIIPEASAAWGLTLGQAIGTTAFWGVSYGQIALVGAALTLSGIAQVVAPIPNAKTQDDPSYAFTGPVNTSQEGVPVPVVYGDVMIGSVVGAMTMATSNYQLSEASLYGSKGGKGQSSKNSYNPIVLATQQDGAPPIAPGAGAIVFDQDVGYYTWSNPSLVGT